MLNFDIDYRYAIFAGLDGEARGGMDDLICIVADLDKVRLTLDGFECDWAHVWDLEERRAARVENSLTLTDDLLRQLGQEVALA